MLHFSILVYPDGLQKSIYQPDIEILLPIFFCKRETNELLFLCFLPRLSMIILSHRKTEKKIFMVSAWLVFGYGWSVFG